jgi:hypothetical protein
LDIKIEHKYIFLIKLNWILKDYNNVTLWIIDTNEKHNFKCLILSSRKIFFSENVNINDILKVYNYKESKIIVKSSKKKKLFIIF